MADIHVFVMTVDDDETFDTQTRAESRGKALIFRNFCSSRQISCIKVGPEHACRFVQACVFQFEHEGEVVSVLEARSLREGGDAAKASLMDLLQSLPDQSVVIAHAQFMSCLRCDGFVPEDVRSRSVYRITLRGGEIHDIVEIDTRHIVAAAAVEEASEATARSN